MKYADRIKSIMKSRDMKQIPLANISGISQSSVNRILNGKTTPNHKTLVKLAKSLGIPVEALTHPDDSIAKIIYELSLLDQDHIKTIREYVEAIRSYKNQSSKSS